MRATIYDWMRQTPEHREFGQMMYPLTHELVVSHNTYNDFARTVQGLPKGNFMRYQAENHEWMNVYGRNWIDMGCLREAWIGQRSTGREIHHGPTRGSLAGLGAVMRTPSYPRGISGFPRRVPRARNFGAAIPGDASPPDPSGWTKSAVGPVGDQWIPGKAGAIPGYIGWVRQIGAVRADPIITGTGERWDPWALIYATADGQVARWFVRYSRDEPAFPAVALPPGADPDLVVGTQPMIKNLQQALNKVDARDFEGKKLVVDGIIGPRTCWACYQFQNEIPSLASQPTLTGDFFSYLGLPANYSDKLAGACAAHYQATPTPTPSAPTPTDDYYEDYDPLVTRAGPNKYLLVGAGAILVGGLLAWRMSR